MTAPEDQSQAGQRSTDNERSADHRIDGHGGGPAPPEGATPLPNLYDDLKGLAASYLHRQRPDHTLQPTALVHEVYMRLAKSKHAEGMEPTEMMKLAASAMRSVLVDHARRKSARKRKGPGQRVPLEMGSVVYAENAIDLIALDDALVRLAEFEPQWSTIVEMRFFGGCTEDEIADLLELSTRTVRRHWRMARAWLRTELEGSLDLDGGRAGGE
ncbi:MAG: ECF-type sigma factor [Planctomycetota bacterium]|jgi:RNA polymerase sigma factor (TIGR02999 family)